MIIFKCHTLLSSNCYRSSFSACQFIAHKIHTLSCTKTIDQAIKSVASSKTMRNYCSFSSLYMKQICMSQKLNCMDPKRLSSLANIKVSPEKSNTYIMESLTIRLQSYNGLHRSKKCWMSTDNSDQKEKLQRLREKLMRQQDMLQEEMEERKNAEARYRALSFVALAICILGLSYGAVPAYKVFCQKTGRGGASVQGNTDIEEMELGEREITVQFNADVDSKMRWNFKPQQDEVTVRTGETALAFYSAMNPTKEPIIGISTYTVTPWEAGYYFNKIQCFCFEEQILNPGEQVDLPVFFYIDPEYETDPALEKYDTVVLSYTFFESKDQDNIPIPDYVKPHLETAKETNENPA